VLEASCFILPGTVRYFLKWPRRGYSLKWLWRGILVLVASYILLFAAVLSAMLQPPARFGQFMKHMPAALVWGALPAPRMWLWARRGDIQEGSPAPDFTLTSHDHSRRVTLSSHQGDRPVVLVFGSYT
jgi:hypothetical protein